MYSKSDNRGFTTNDDANDVVHEIFESLLSRYQIGLKTSMTGSDFIFDSVLQMSRIINGVDHI